MTKTILFGFLLCFCFSCNQAKNKIVESDSNFLISVENWPETSKINSNSKGVIDKWLAFKAFDEAINNLYTVENKEDLNLIIEDLVEKHKLLKSSVFPTEYNISQIKSRLKVVHTFILKTKGNLTYGLNPEEPIKEMLNAYNDLRNQVDIISSNTFDIKTLLEED